MAPAVAPKLLLPSLRSSVASCDSRATTIQPEPPAEDSRAQHQLSGNVPARDLHLNGTVGEKLLTLLIQELKR